MPFTLYSSSNPIRITCHGDLTASDARQVLYESPQIDRATNRLIDLRAAEDFRFSGAELMLNSAEASLESYPNPYRCALLIESPLSRGIARMWQNLNELAAAAIEVFVDEKEALEWLAA
ncbi:MAG: hypothetical protein ACI8UO_002206 [Verrucomicrobiales bacterium]|jgi:hypothetical protein